MLTLIDAFWMTAHLIIDCLGTGRMYDDDGNGVFPLVPIKKGIQVHNILLVSFIHFIQTLCAQLLIDLNRDDVSRG